MADSQRVIAPRTLEVLDVAAGDLDVNIRQEAVSLLVRFNSHAEPHASRGLYDPSPYVRRRTVDSLVQRLPEDASRELLSAFVRRDDLDPYTRGHAALQLALAGHVDAREIISAAAEEEKQWWRAAPLHLAALAMGSEESLTPLLAALEKGDFPLEMGFFLDCHRLGRAELGKALVTAAGRVEEELVLPIASSLVWLGDPAGAALFRERLDSTVVEARLEAIDFIAELEGEVAESLVDRAARDGEASVSGYARLVKVRWGLESPAVAIEMLDHVDREVRAQALWALAGHIELERRRGTDRRRLESRVMDCAETALSDTEDVVVREGIRLLGALGGARAVELLEPLYSMESVAFRVEVAAALLRSG